MSNVQQAISVMGISKHLSTDHDLLLEYYRWKANLRITDFEEIQAIPDTPMSYPFVEKLIRTLRQEFLVQVIF